MKYDKDDKIKVNGSIQEIENIAQWDKDTQRYKFVGGSGWHKIKDYDKRFWLFSVKERRRNNEMDVLEEKRKQDENSRAVKRHSI